MSHDFQILKNIYNIFFLSLSVFKPSAFFKVWPLCPHIFICCLHQFFYMPSYFVLSVKVKEKTILVASGRLVPVLKPQSKGEPQC